MHLKRFIANAAGAAAVEFALVAPVLIVMYFGLAELTEAMIAERRVSHTGSTIGDLVAQAAAVTPAEVADIFTVGTAIVSPFPTATLSMRVTSITADAKNVATVDWSKASNTTPMAKGAVVKPPAGAIGAGQSVIKADVRYVYTSPVNYILRRPITFSNTYYLRPRVSAQVSCPNC